MLQSEIANEKVEPNAAVQDNDVTHEPVTSGQPDGREMARTLADLPSEEIKRIGLAIMRDSRIWWRILILVPGAVLSLLFSRDQATGIALRLTSRHAVLNNRRTFIALQALDEQSKGRIRHMALRALNRTSAIEIRQARQGIAAVVGAIALSVAATPALIHFSFNFHGHSPGLIILIGMVPVTALISCAAILLITRGASLPASRSRFVAYLCTILLIGSAVRMEVLVWHPSLAFSLADWYVEVSVYCSLLLSLMGLILFAVAIILNGEAYRRRAPDAALISLFISLIRKVEKAPNQWLLLGFRKDCIRMLESAAAYMERDVRRSLQPRDALRDGWARGQYAEIAEAIRDLKTWLLLPKAETKDAFLCRIAATLTHIADGDWDALDRKKPDPEAVGKLWHIRLLSFVSPVAVTILIELIAFSLKHIGISVPEGWHAVGPILLAATFVLQFQPSIIANMDLLKGIREILNNK